MASLSQTRYSIAALALLVAGCSSSQSQLQCGIYSLSEVFRVAKVSADYKDIYSQTRVEKGEVSMAELKRVADTFGVPLVGLKLANVKELCRYSASVIELQDAHFVAVSGCTSNGLYQVMDSAKGQELWSEKRLELEWTGRALVLTQNPHERQP